MCRLGTEGAIFSAASGLGIDDGAEMNLVSDKMLFDPVCRREQVGKIM